MKGLLTAGLVFTSCAVVHATPRAMQDHDHDHDHGDMSCACHSEHDEHTFTLSCTDTSGINDSATALEACAQSEEACHAVASDGTEPCQTAFFHLMYIHGACPHDTLSEAQELLIHTYDDYCAACGVQRAHEAGLPDCQQPTDAQCTDSTASNGALVAKAVLDAATAAGTVVCADNETATIDAWRTLLAYHDLCDHDVLPTEAEMAVHAYEEACETKNCNTVDASYDPAVCVEEPDDDHAHDHAEDTSHACDEDDHDHSHRRRLGGEHEDECEHSHVWIWVLLVIGILAIGAVIFMKVQGLFCFATDDEKGSSG